jgi:thymidylate kinase
MFKIPGRAVEPDPTFFLNVREDVAIETGENENPSITDNPVSTFPLAESTLQEIRTIFLFPKTECSLLIVKAMASPF